MPQEPFTGTQEQVLRMMALMAGGAAYTLEAQAYVAGLATGIGALEYAIKDINGTQYTLNLGEQEFNDTSWVHTAFIHGQITSQLQVVGPFPMIEFIGGSTSLQTRRDGSPFETDDGVTRGNKFSVDVVYICEQDEPQARQREALIMGAAYERLIQRNQNLGGLVQLIHIVNPVQAGGGGIYRDSGLVMAARTRFEVLTLTVS